MDMTICIQCAIYLSCLENELVQDVFFWIFILNLKLLLFYEHNTVNTVILWPCDFQRDSTVGIATGYELDD
jgi:hypothetical protein